MAGRANLRTRIVAALKWRVEPVADPVTAALGRVRSARPRIMRSVQGERGPAPKQAVFVHHDRDGVVHDYVHFAVGELAANGYAVTFVSNAPKLCEAGVARLLPVVREVVHRRGVGYDFGAWRDGIERLPDFARLERLILANDSVYGPVFPLREALARAEAMDVDVFGITDSREIAHHLQSYFLMFFPRALAAPAFRAFWADFPMVNAKSWIVRNGEVRLSVELARAGLRLGALCPYDEVSRAAEAQAAPESAGEEARRFLLKRRRRLAAGKPLNPMHHFWEDLITARDCPFLKRDLIRSNPAGVPELERWAGVLRRSSGYDIDLVLRHLDAGRETTT